MLRKKVYPDNYASDVVTILDTMAFPDGDITLVGSASLRSQQYAGDYDAFQYVKGKSLKSLASQFQTIIRNLQRLPNVYIGDCKAGVVPDWEVVKGSVVDGKIVGFDLDASKSKLRKLRKDGVISGKEMMDSMKLLKPKMSPIDLIVAKGEIKYHVVRWSVEDILRGSKVLRDGRAFTLENGFGSPGLTKLDVIGLVQNSRFTDFSMIYEFSVNGKVMNPVPIDIEQSLKENILYYTAVGNPLKVVKREFALAKYRGEEKKAGQLSAILNSDVGRLYQISGDIGTLLNLLEDHKVKDLKRVLFEIDQFKDRLSNVYLLKSYLKKEYEVIGRIESALKSKSIKQLYSNLKFLKAELDSSIVNGIKSKQ